MRSLTLRTLLWLVITVWLGWATAVQAQRISTVAGGVNAGDGAAAANARVYTPKGVAVDAAGNVFIADANNHRIRKVAVGTGVITTVAGTGVSGFGGDGGLAIEAALNEPRGVAVDTAGNLYIADYTNHRIRKVTFATGIINTLAGTGVASSTGDGGAATSATIRTPAGLALNAGGDVFFAEELTHRVRKITVSTGGISTVAGTGTASALGTNANGDGGAATSATLNAPMGVAIDSAGDLFIADRSNHKIRKVTGTTMSTIAGTGSTFGSAADGSPATGVALNSPQGVMVDGSGNVYIASTGQKTVRRVTGTAITTIAGILNAGSFSGYGGNAASANLNDPVGVALDGSGNLFIADSLNQRVRKVTGTTITTYAGNGSTTFYGDGGPATGAIFINPAAVAFDALGNMYIADRGQHRVRKVEAGTGITSTVAGTGTASFSGDSGAATSATLSNPFAVALDTAGNLFIADADNHRIRKVAAGTGIITTVAGTGATTYNGDSIAATTANLNSPRGLAVDSGGNVYIAEFFNHRVRKVTGTTITTLAGTGTLGNSGDNGAPASAQLANPAAIALNSAGDLFIADYGNRRVRKVANGGNITAVAGTGAFGSGGDGGLALNATFNNPFGVAVDAAGNLYISDQGTHRVRKVATGTAIITAFAGDGVAAFLGDGGPAATARLFFPSGLAVDGAGNLYIADQNNVRIRKVSVAGARVDFNGDGKSDILWRNTATGDNYIYLMNGLSIAGEGYTRTVPLGWTVAGVADFDGDGKADILWRNTATGDNYIYLMNGLTIAGEGYTRTVPLAWTVVNP